MQQRAACGRERANPVHWLPAQFRSTILNSVRNFAELLEVLACPRQAHTEAILHHLPHVPAVLGYEVAQLATGHCNLQLHGLDEPAVVHHQLTAHHVCIGPCEAQVADTPHMHVSDCRNRFLAHVEHQTLAHRLLLRP